MSWSCVAALLAVALETQTPPPRTPPRDAAVPAATGTATIRGRVISLDGERPLRRAHVSVGSPQLAEGRRFVRGEGFDEQPMPGLDSEALDFRAASESFAPHRKLARRDLETLRLVTDYQWRKVPTVGGMILFGKDRERHFPDAWIQAGRFAGTDRSHIADRTETRSLPARAVEEAIAFVQKHALYGAEIGAVRRQALHQRDCGRDLALGARNAHPVGPPRRSRSRARDRHGAAGSQAALLPGRARTGMSPTPEQQARIGIDAALEAAGWIVQDRATMNLAAGTGVAVREFKMTSGHGFADYLLIGRNTARNSWPWRGRWAAASDSAGRRTG